VSTTTIQTKKQPAPAKRGGFRRFYVDHRPFVRGLTSVVVVLVAWQVITTHYMKNSLAIAPPSAIIRQYGVLARNGQLWLDCRTSGEEFLIGFLLASGVGLLLGLFMGAFRALREYLDPLVNALYATPVIALGPLFILWFGIGIDSKIAVVFILAVLPVTISTETGIRTVDPHLLEVARAFSASRPQVFRKIMLPAALPLIVTGLRLGVGRGLLGVVAGELFAAQHGLGYRILFSSQLFNPAGVFVGITALAATGIVSMVLLRRLEKRLAPWRTEVDE
jgi:taurine transport system permease protein